MKTLRSSTATVPNHIYKTLNNDVKNVFEKQLRKNAANRACYQIEIHRDGFAVDIASKCKSQDYPSNTMLFVTTQGA